MQRLTYVGTFKYFTRIVSCACQPAVGEGLLPERSISVKETRSETAQVNARMATADHDRRLHTDGTNYAQ